MGITLTDIYESGWGGLEVFKSICKRKTLTFGLTMNGEGVKSPKNLSAERAHTQELAR